MIGDMKTLVNAANGTFIPRSIPKVDQGNEASPYLEAFQRKQEYGMAKNDPKRPFGYTLPGNLMPATKTYLNLLSGYVPSPQGLSGKGKYGGFMTAADRDAAIAGAATEFSSGAPSKLRSLAEQRYNDVETLRSKAYNQLLKNYIGDRGLGRSFRAFEEITQNKAPGLPEYSNKLANWYKQNVAPAEDYLATAQQIESTPLSQLASSLASSAYGMNPQLAMGKFTGLDTQVFERNRDAQYLQQYGMSYDEYQNKRQIGKQQAEDVSRSIESMTGIPTSQLVQISGMDAPSLYGLISQQNIKLSTGQLVNADVLINEARNYLDKGGDEGRQGINDIISELQSVKQYDLANLINALTGLIGRKKTVAEDYRNTYFNQ